MLLGGIYLEVFDDRTAVVVLGELFERLSRTMNRSYEKSVSLLMVKLKHGDSRMRSEILSTMERLVNGLGLHVSEIHREISKAAKTYMSDRVMSVRSAAAKVRVS